MSTLAYSSPARILSGYQRWLPDLLLGLQNLLLHRLRTLLTMLGMIFGVAAVVSMLSIGAGARQKVMRRECRDPRPRRAPVRTGARHLSRAAWAGD